MKLKEKLTNVVFVRRCYAWCYDSFFKTLALISPRLFYVVKCRFSALRRWPDLKSPRIFAEKMIWLTVNWRHPMKSQCADKYAVREYVKKCGCEDLLTPLIGVWNRVEDIDFDVLPQRFALKCNHGCGCNIICKDKTRLDLEDAKKKLRRWMKRDYGRYSGEIHYSGIKPRIICEEYLEDGDNLMPIDYKFFMLSGRPYFCLVISDRKPGIVGHVRYHYYDPNWKRVRNVLRDARMDSDISETEKPACYEKMLAAAVKLAKPFPFVRVDFYSINGRAYFGELTFTPAGGLEDKWTDEVQERLGALITLPSPIR